MKLNDYQTEARRTAIRPRDAYPAAVRAAADKGLEQLFDAMVYALGLAGEAGEVADLLKKIYGHGKPHDGEKLKAELGDVLWYLSNLADAHGFTLEQVAQANVEKLRKRYPEGFTVAAAQAKADEKPALVEKVIYTPHGFDANGAPVHPDDFGGSDFTLDGEPSDLGGW